MKNTFIWNFDKTGSIRASVVRNFAISPGEEEFLVIAWINDEQSIKMGAFKSESEARGFLGLIHRQMDDQ